MRVTYIVGLAFALQFAALSSAHAQPVSLPPPSWHDGLPTSIAEILLRAERAAQAGDLAKAIAAYEEANAQDECAAVGVELGLALLRAGRTVEGARRLHWAMMFSPLPLSHRPTAHLLRQLEEARNKIGTLLIHTNTDSVALAVDGARVWEYPSRLELYVEPEKKHTLMAAKSGYWVASTEVKVGAGEVREVLLTLEPRIMQQVTALPLQFNRRVGRRWPQQQESKTMLYVSTAGVGISLAAGLVGAAVRVNGEERGNPEMVTASTALFIGGGIGIGLSLTGFMVHAASRPAPQIPQPVVTISPALAKNQVGLGMQGTF